MSYLSNVGISGKDESLEPSFFFVGICVEVSDYARGNCPTLLDEFRYCMLEWNMSLY